MPSPAVGLGRRKVAPVTHPPSSTGALASTPCSTRRPRPPRAAGADGRNRTGATRTRRSAMNAASATAARSIVPSVPYVRRPFAGAKLRRRGAIPIRSIAATARGVRPSPHTLSRGTSPCPRPSRPRRAGRGGRRPPRHRVRPPPPGHRCWWEASKRVIGTVRGVRSGRPDFVNGFTKCMLCPRYRRQTGRDLPGGTHVTVKFACPFRWLIDPLIVIFSVVPSQDRVSPNRLERRSPHLVSIDSRQRVGVELEVEGADVDHAVEHRGRGGDVPPVVASTAACRPSGSRSSRSTPAASKAESL